MEKDSSRHITPEEETTCAYSTVQNSRFALIEQKVDRSRFISDLNAATWTVNWAEMAEEGWSGLKSRSTELTNSSHPNRIRKSVNPEYLKNEIILVVDINIMTFF